MKKSPSPKTLKRFALPHLLAKSTASEMRIYFAVLFGVFYGTSLTYGTKLKKKRKVNGNQSSSERERDGQHWKESRTTVNQNLLYYFALSFSRLRRQLPLGGRLHFARYFQMKINFPPQINYCEYSIIRHITLKRKGK